MMSSTRHLIASALLVANAVAANELVSGGGSVTVTSGPNECDEVDRVKVGDHLEMHYTGTIDKTSKAGTPGQKFDSSRDHGETFPFTIGHGEVIDGWDKGLLGLCKGAHATLVVPPEFGYGDDGAGDDIPGGATLNFEVEVVAVGGEDEEHAPMDADQHDEPMDGGFEEPMDGEFEEGHEEPYDHESDPYDDPYKVGYFVPCMVHAQATVKSPRPTMRICMCLCYGRSPGGSKPTRKRWPRLRRRWETMTISKWAGPVECMMSRGPLAS